MYSILSVQPCWANIMEVTRLAFQNRFPKVLDVGGFQYGGTPSGVVRATTTLAPLVISANVYEAPISRSLKHQNGSGSLIVV